MNGSVDTANASFEFLRLGGYELALKYFPPAITHVLKVGCAARRGWGCGHESLEWALRGTRRAGILPSFLQAAAVAPSSFPVCRCRPPACP